MSEPVPWDSGKDETQENFPVASMLVAARHRPIVMAFYRVARMADDVADHALAGAADKLARLAAIESSLRGEDDTVAEAVRLRRLLAERRLTDRHVFDLLEAFRRDVRRNRYANWDELMDYCRFSAAPVGRFVLDIHGEPEGLWPVSDALCAALQVINHLQDCGKDYRELDRVYIPLDALGAAGLAVRALGEPAASPALRQVIGALASRTTGLLDVARPFAGEVKDLRLGLEIGVIQRLAEDLTARLRRRDPLSQRVHHRKAEAVGLAVLGLGGALFGRLGSARASA